MNRQKIPEIAAKCIRVQLFALSYQLVSVRGLCLRVSSDRHLNNYNALAVRLM